MFIFWTAKKQNQKSSRYNVSSSTVLRSFVRRCKEPIPLRSTVAQFFHIFQGRNWAQLAAWLRTKALRTIGYPPTYRTPTADSFCLREACQVATICSPRSVPRQTPDWAKD